MMKLVPAGGELLQILSQQDQETSSPEEDQPGTSSLAGQTPDDEDVQEPIAGAAAHTVGEADGAPTDGRDEELHSTLAAETEHKVCINQLPDILKQTAYQHACVIIIIPIVDVTIVHWHLPGSCSRVHLSFSKAPVVTIALLPLAPLGDTGWFGPKG